MYYSNQPTRSEGIINEMKTWQIGKVVPKNALEYSKVVGKITANHQKVVKKMHQNAGKSLEKCIFVAR